MENIESKCPECKGSGLIMLLTSTAPCRKCGGVNMARTEAVIEAGVPERGAAADATHPPACQGSPPPFENVKRSVITYDAQGRLIQQISFGDFTDNTGTLVCRYDGGSAQPPGGAPQDDSASTKR